MSYELADKAIKCVNVKGTEKLVLIVLCSFADKKTSQCYPSLDRLASRAGLNERTIRRAIKSLEDEGIISIQHRSHNNLKTSSLYKINGKKIQLDTESTRTDTESTRTDTESTRTDTESTTNRTESPLGLDRESDKPTIEPTNINQSINQPVICADPEQKKSKSKKEKIDHTEKFLEFWQQYPKKAGKPKAFEAYKKALTRATHSEIIKGVMIYAEENKNNAPKYIKHPQGWLNDDRWGDEPTKTGSIYEKQGATNIPKESNAGQTLRVLGEIFQELED